MKFAGTNLRTFAIAASLATLMLGGGVPHVSGAALPTSVPGFSSQFNIGATDRKAIHAVDGSGLDANNPPGHTNQPNGNMWLNTGDGSSGGGVDPDRPSQLADITFNLGSLATVDSFRVWNYNELNGFNNRSIQTLTISTASSFGGPYTFLINPSTSTTTWTFAEAPGTTSYTGQLFTLPNPFTAQYVRFDIETNYGPDPGGADHGFVGLSEIQFFSAVPEPATWVAMGLTALILVAGRFRWPNKCLLNGNKN